MNHTPGPWQVRQQYGTNGEVVFECIDNDAEVGSENWKTIGSTWAEPNPANARLMAAAPDLLASLDKLADHVEYTLGTWKGCPYLVQARAAIAKATGVEQ